MSRDIIEAIVRKQLEIAGVPADAKNPDGTWLQTSMNGLIVYLNAAHALGYELVPKEPSPAMRRSGQFEGQVFLSEMRLADAEAVYKAMVSAGRIAID